ncbi:uncharacterized protein LOC121728236 [Aricia agestis]|uniref:uncharacterized protein LOC121728236 n=1 Tax=Aricia agestis TaxID=91739 RepID=UPI001C2095A6|nr:uncharacterized protein LOC121728236 [Aricia agestis]
MLRLVLLSALLVCARAQSTAVSRCVNNAGDLPINTQVSGCVTPPCQLPQLTMAEIDIIFRAPRTIRSMGTFARASLLLGSFEAPAISYPLGAAEITCDYITNTYCPLMEGEVVQYRLNMFIEAFFPIGTNANVEFFAADENSQPVFCLRMAIGIIRGVDALAGAVNGTSDRI